MCYMPVCRIIYEYKNVAIRVGYSNTTIPKLFICSFFFVFTIGYKRNNFTHIAKNIIEGKIMRVKNKTYVHTHTHIYFLQKMSPQKGARVQVLQTVVLLLVDKHYNNLYILSRYPYIGPASFFFFAVQKWELRARLVSVWWYLE